MSIKKNNQKGFTLVELVIVLAIAAIILAGVLVAVGGAQRSQRDTTRKSIAGRTATALENFASNHNGTYTGFACDATYCNGITDPDSNGFPIAGSTPNGVANGVEYDLGKNCAGAAQARSYAIYFYSENAKVKQCIDNG